MIIAGTHNARGYLQAGWRVLLGGGRALDAVEAVAREVEADLAEHSVGIGGFPNLAGEVELDASIMDGRTRACGAVAAVRRYGHPISVARRVMEHLPHVLLVGRGAEDFAREMGFAEEDLLTAEAAAAWKARLAATVPEGEVPALLARERMARHALLLEDASRAAGTVDVIGVDARGDFASAVSTSGWAWKYPGRVGDSPIAGRGQLLRQPLRRRGVRRPRGAHDPRLHRASHRAADGDGPRRGGGLRLGPPRPARRADASPAAWSPCSRSTAISGPGARARRIAQSPPR